MSQEFAILTDEVSNGTLGMSVSVYKEYYLLPARANLLDHMISINLAFSGRVGRYH
jgi:hypothetical protein